MTESVTKRLSFISSWMSMSAGDNNNNNGDQKETEEEFKERMSAIVEGRESTSERSYSTLDGLARDDLVRELQGKLQRDMAAGRNDATYTLSAWELRLLVGMPMGQGSSMRSSSSLTGGTKRGSIIPPPPPTMTPMATSNVFDNWDFTSFFDESLSGDEISAIMIALAAEEQEHKQRWPERPPPTAAREISIRAMDTPRGDVEIIVNLDGSLSLINDCEDSDDEEEQKTTNNPIVTNSGRPQLKGHRQVSIQQLDQPEEIKRPSQIQLEGRQASVTHSADKSGQYVVTFSGSKDSAEEAEAPPRTPLKRGVRRLSIQPSARNLLANVNNNIEEKRKAADSEELAAAAEARPGMVRQVSVRLNGGETKSFQFVI